MTYEQLHKFLHELLHTENCWFNRGSTPRAPNLGSPHPEIVVGRVSPRSIRSWMDRHHNGDKHPWENQ